MISVCTCGLGRKTECIIHGIPQKTTITVSASDGLRLTAERTIELKQELTRLREENEALKKDVDYWKGCWKLQSEHYSNVKSQLALAEKALVFAKESCEESDWSCSRCEKENDMTTADLYSVICEALKQIRGEG